MAGAPAAYFYSQDSALQNKQTTLNSQITSLQSNEASLRAQITSLEANVTALTAQKAKLSANVTSSAQQIANLNEEVNTDTNTISNDTQQLNLYAAQLNVLQGIAAHENLIDVQTLWPADMLSWSGGSSCANLCATGAWFYGPYTITNFAGYLNFTFTNPSSPNAQMLVNVTWDGYGYHYSDVQSVTGTGTITFPVLITNDLNFMVEPTTSSGNVTLTILWYD